MSNAVIYESVPVQAYEAVVVDELRRDMFPKIIHELEVGLSLGFTDIEITVYDEQEMKSEILRFQRDDEIVHMYPGQLYTPALANDKEVSVEFKREFDKVFNGRYVLVAHKATFES